VTDIWDVRLVPEVEEWFLSLRGPDLASVAVAIDVLAAVGPTLGRPLADRVTGSRHHNMKELRPAGTTIRVLFAFDPRRRAVLLVGGDKSGRWKRRYDDNIPLADERYDTWLAGGYAERED
jgi:hypothetical protein